MAVTASLLMDRKPGTLLRAVSVLVREGWQVESNRISETLGSELARVVFSIAGELDPSKLKALLTNVSGVVKVESIQVNAAPATSTNLGDENEAVERAFLEIAKKLDNAGRVLLVLERQISAEDWPQTSRNLGARLGLREFKRNYALGLPLQFDAAIKRMVVPALKPLGKAKAVGDGIISITECTVCGGMTGSIPICFFISGFIEGLMGASAPTKGAVVTEEQCSASGAMCCEFQVMLA